MSTMLSLLMKKLKRYLESLAENFILSRHTTSKLPKEKDNRCNVFV